VAGGGLKGGRVVGSSDARGEEVKERPVYPCDLIASLYERLGIDPDGKLPHPLGREARGLLLRQEFSGQRLLENSVDVHKCQHPRAGGGCLASFCALEYSVFAAGGQSPPAASALLPYLAPRTGG
jgi:hypothetical protein